ncbi:MAG: hypothetical protein ACN4GZ_06125 [Acidimicrobiales bacterium]
MADRIAVRLDPETEADLGFLAQVHGSQTAAIKKALSEMAKRERLFAAMDDFVSEVEAETGPITDAEVATARGRLRGSR